MRKLEPRALAAMQDAMTTAVGGDPSPQMAIVIQQASWLQVHLNRRNADFLATGKLDVNEYTALNSALFRALSLIGMERRAKPVKRLADVIAEQAGTGEQP